MLPWEASASDVFLASLDLLVPLFLASDLSFLLSGVGRLLASASSLVVLSLILLSSLSGFSFSAIAEAALAVALFKFWLSISNEIYND